MKVTSDPLKRLVANTLDLCGIEYLCPDQDPTFGLKLDFYLPTMGIYIECKSPRTYIHKQAERDAHNCIVLIGMKATQMFCDLMLLQRRK